MIRILSPQRLLFAAFIATIAAPACAQVPTVGDTRPNPEILGRLYAAVCFGSASLEEAQATLERAGMRVNPDTGTYFHAEFDLSTNPGGGECTMVFVTDRATDLVIAEFRNSLALVVGAAANDVSLSGREQQGETYIRAGIPERW